MGEVIRRLTARTMAQQLRPAIEAATAPFQYALSTRAGCECVSHALQAISELDEDATVTSIDGISAYDTISRRAMIAGLECQAAVLHHVMFGCSIQSFPHICGKMRKAWCTQFTKEKEDPLMPLLVVSGTARRAVGNP